MSENFIPPKPPQIKPETNTVRPPIPPQIRQVPSTPPQNNEDLERMSVSQTSQEDTQYYDAHGEDLSLEGQSAVETLQSPKKVLKQRTLTKTHKTIIFIVLEALCLVMIGFCCYLFTIFNF